MRLTSARSAIIDAYSIFRMQKDIAGDADLFSKPKTLVKRTNKKRSFTYLTVDGKKKTGYMPAVEVKPVETRAGRTSTTFRVANLIEAGHIIAAAEGGYTKRWPAINWGWFAYHCDDNHRGCEKLLTAAILQLYVGKLKKKPIKRIAYYETLAGLALLDHRSRMNNGRLLFNGADIARRLRVSDSNYRMSWERHYNAMGELIDILDRSFLVPISTVIFDMLLFIEDEDINYYICKPYVSRA